MESWRLTEQECEQLNPPLLEIAEDEDGQLYHKATDDPKWLFVGYIPIPQTALGWFMYHLIHGLAMRYPVCKVLIFSVAHSFLESPAIIAENGEQVLTVKNSERIRNLKEQSRTP